MFRERKELRIIQTIHFIEEDAEDLDETSPAWGQRISVRTEIKAFVSHIF